MTRASGSLGVHRCVGCVRPLAQVAMDPCEMSMSMSMSCEILVGGRSVGWLKVCFLRAPGFLSQAVSLRIPLGELVCRRGSRCSRQSGFSALP